MPLNGRNRRAIHSQSADGSAKSQDSRDLTNLFILPKKQEINTLASDKDKG